MSPLPPNAQAAGRRALLALAILAAALGAGLAAAPQAAAKPCSTELINDWYDGRIDKSYPLRCYRQALKELPEDVETYSSARDDIERALLQASRRKRGAPPVDPNTIVPPPRFQRPRTTQTETAPAPTTSTRTDTTSTETSGIPPDEGDPTAGGSLGDDIFRPERADSLPVPLLILGALALLLLLAGAAAFAARRLQSRRIPPARLPGDARPPL
ncbi:MAG: hypothetical protein H0V40_02260 [Actinobacteria bacterium]|nr:hypothetical protein [Actinomycetota bacterium]